MEWRLGESGDPAALLTSFLAAYGLGRARRPSGPVDHREQPLSGDRSVVQLSSYRRPARRPLSGRPTGAPSPAPAVPDLVVVVYAHSVTEPFGPGVTVGARSGWGTGSRAGPQDEHADAVRAVRAAIADGDVYQVNVVGHASAPYAGDPLPALRRLAAPARGPLRPAC